VAETINNTYNKLKYRANFETVIVNCTNVYFITLPSELNYILASKVPNETPILFAINVLKLTYGHFRSKNFSGGNPQTPIAKGGRV
jgi:hypothetical protein